MCIFLCLNLEYQILIESSHSAMSAKINFNKNTKSDLLF